MARLGLTLALALALLGTGLWGGVAGWATHEARRALRQEAYDVQSAIVAADGSVDVTRYDWDEPHHRFGAARIDPYFLQVFDARGRLVRASENVAGLAPEAFPTRPLASTAGDGALVPLATFRIGGQRLYRITEPLLDARGERVGTVQVARFVPPLVANLGRLGGALALGLVGLLATLLALVWTVGGRVVRPLQAMTAHAADLSAATLGERVTVPPEADREAAVLGATLNDALDRLDGAFDEMRRFTANAAHELQTPLTVLRGHVDVALRREREPEAYRETLRLLGSEVDGMVETVRGLLALARLDASGAALDTEPVDLAALAVAEADAVRGRAEAKGLALHVHAEPTSARGHPGLLRDVTRNLLDNAIKYTDAGRIDLYVGARGGEVCLVVEDTGPGIAPEHEAHVADRFWRADGVQHLPGKRHGARPRLPSGGAPRRADEGGHGGLRRRARLGRAAGGVAASGARGRVPGSAVRRAVLRTRSTAARGWAR